jgi:hypothetical protein
MLSLTYEFKINRSYLLLRISQCVKFDVCQGKNSQDIEWPIYPGITMTNFPLDSD